MALIQEGTIELIFEKQEIKNGAKQEFLINTGGEYPQKVKLECAKNLLNVMSNYSIGEKVNVHFNLRGNEYQGKYYTNLQAWKIENV